MSARRSIRVITALAVALAALIVAALIVIRPVLLLPVIVGVTAGIAVGAVVTLRRRAEPQRHAVSRRPRQPSRHRPPGEPTHRKAEETYAADIPYAASPAESRTLEDRRGPGTLPLALAAVTAALAVVAVWGTEGLRYVDPSPHEPPTARPANVTVSARYRGIAVLRGSFWQMTESLWLKEPDYLSRGYRRVVREAVRPSAAVSEALEAAGWTVDGRDRWGLKVTREHSEAAEIRGVPHLLTANTLPIGSIRLSRVDLGGGAPSELRFVAEKGSQLTLNTLRRGVYNADPPASSYNVPGGRTDTEFMLPDDGLATVSVDLGNRFARTTLFSALYAAAVWNGIWGLLVLVFTAVVGVWVKNRWEKPSPDLSPVVASSG